MSIVTDTHTITAVVTSQPVVTEVLLPRITLPTIDLLTLKAAPSVVTYQRNLAAAMHGLDSCFIIDCASLMDDGLVATGLKKFKKVAGDRHLDGATGSRKKGKLIGTTATKGVIETYLDNSKRISHGSILFSECRKMFSIQGLRYVVQPDTADGLGDCHGYISESLAIAIGIQDRVTQYRFGVRDQWVAKGVVTTYPDAMMPEGIDAVFPDSSFKGRCPDLYVSQLHDAFFGIMNIAKPLNMKSSHQVLQCFESPESHQHLLTKAEESFTELMELRSYPTEFAKFLLDAMNSQSNTEEEEEDGADDQCVSPVLEVIAADKYAQLHRHPVVNAALTRLLRRKVADIATGKFLSATGLMATPMNTLKPGYVLTRSLPTGEYIYWRYPVRHYGDIRPLKVVNPTDMSSRQLARYFTGGMSKLNRFDMHRALTLAKGAFAINPDWFLEVGGDHDGDLACFLPAEVNECLLTECKSWTPLPVIEKPAKISIQRTLEQIAAESMSNSIGILASMMSACRYFGLRNEFAYLGLQIQLVVDAFKSDTPVDKKYLEKLGKQLGQLEEAGAPNLPWFRQHKEPALFDTLRVNIIDDKGDIIARLMKSIDLLWADVDSPFQTLEPPAFAFLYQSMEVKDSTNKKAAEYLAQYRKESAELNALWEPNGGIPKAAFKEFQGKWCDWATDIRAKLTTEQMNEVVAAFWALTHKRGLKHVPVVIFRMFWVELAGRVSTLQSVDNIGFRLFKQLDTEVTTDTIEAVVSHDIANGGLYLWTTAGDRIGRVITDGVSRKVFIPAEGHAFPCRIEPNINGKGELSYHHVQFVVA